MSRKACFEEKECKAASSVNQKSDLMTPVKRSRTPPFSPGNLTLPISNPFNYTLLISLPFNYTLLISRPVILKFLFLEK